jgi:hypothetical protein
MNDRLSSNTLFVGVDCRQPEIWPMMGHQPLSKAASAHELSNTTQAKATSKDIQNAVLLVSIQPVAGG